jgi:hypothetical protein
VLAAPEGGCIAYVVRDGRAGLRRLETGIEQGGRVQIVSGIEPGDSVVTAGGEKLRDGVLVRPIDGKGEMGGAGGASESGAPSGARGKSAATEGVVGR